MKRQTGDYVLVEFVGPEKKYYVGMVMGDYNSLVILYYRKADVPTVINYEDMIAFKQPLEQTFIQKTGKT